MKVLVVSPSFKLLGGVANHYLGLKKYWDFDVRYEFYGKRKSIPAPLTFGFDLLKFTFKLVFQRPDIVIVNPSLRKYQLFRDGIYLRIARLFGIPVVTFLHGWDDQYAEVLVKDGKSFKRIYNKSALIFVLAQEFKDKLKEIGITSEITLTTTKVNDELLEHFSISKRDGKVTEILFLARVIEQKGIFITIRAFQLLQPKYPQLVLRIVGTGPDFERAQDLVKALDLKHVLFRGAIFGKEISKEFEAAQVYIMPSFHGEGMPTSVLEAMAFGMPVITRPLGGLKDFFAVPQMGELIEGFEPEEYAASIEQYLTNDQKCMEIARTNHQYATENFLASSVTKKLERAIAGILHKNSGNVEPNNERPVNG